MTRLLLVEDNPVEARELAAALDRSEFQLEVVPDGEQASARLASGDIALVLCDLHLPGENGFSICRRLKTHEPTRHLPVILLTRYSAPLNFLKGLEAGADGFISKGLPAERLIERIERVLARQRTPATDDEAPKERVVFFDAEFHLNTERTQLLEVLLAELDDIVQLNEMYESEVLARVRAQQSLRKANLELTKLNATLENRVAERTRELERHARALEAKNAELDRFVYFASHDLLEPVRKLVTFGELLKQDLDGELPTDAAEDLDCLTNAAQRIQVLVQDLLYLARSGNGCLRREPVSLDQCADAALDALSLVVQESGATITRDPLPTALGDATTLTLLYQNLISNALKFVNGSRPRVHLSADLTEEGWVLGVADNGIGLEDDEAEQVFAPFYRLHSREQYDGTGIGLAICKTTVERHEGRIWVESRPGEGAHFKFTLPHVELETNAASIGEDPALAGVP